jgi:tocopherol O-methyltransferase
MRINTNEPIYHDREKITQTIAKFWDQISDAWSNIWGVHIHHGYYENDETIITKEDAQEKLIQKLIATLGVNQDDRILDVGCGMGGSSIYLAKHYQAIVTGITLSNKQVDIASKNAINNGVRNVNFKIEDALSLTSFADSTFDIVWSLESCEQFIDKKLFLKNAYRVLKPGGKLLLATWCSSSEEYQGSEAKQYQKLCHAFDVPYMPTINRYLNLMQQESFTVTSSSDWSRYVGKSWEIGVSLADAYSYFQLLKMAGWRGLRFANQIKLMREAFRTGRVQYGVFTAAKCHE